MYQPRAVRTNKKFVAIPQSHFPKGYISTLSQSRMPPDGLATMINGTLEQDSVPRPRPPFIPYGAAFLGTCIGMGTFIKMVGGKPEHWEISMQVISGVAEVCTRKDGGTWTAIGGSYNTSAWVVFTPAAALNSDGTQDSRVYISNGKDAMSYLDIGSNTLITYTGLATPSAPTATPTGLTGTNFTQYYRISANNAGGESAASANGNHQIQVARDFWTTGEYITVTWSAVTGATSYNIYTSDISGQESYLATVSGLTFVDDGSITINVFKQAPSSDSSAGPVVSNMINMDNQLFGVGDPNNPQFLWYSGQGLHLGDFSFNPQGGGYVGIDYGGDSVPTAPFAFHDGHGNPVLSILTHGPAGRGKLYHMQFTTTTVGTTTLTYPNVYEASAQDGTPAQLGVAIYNNNAYYCTGTQFKTTGIKPNVINILSTDTIFNQGIPDLQNLNLGALSGTIAQEYLGKIYFAVATGSSTTNNELWILDLTRGGLWILRWPVSVKYMWLYEDNNGKAHFLTLQGNTVLELDLLRQATPHQDNGVAFQCVIGSGAMVFDKGGVAMFSSYFTYFKLIFPAGQIVANIYGITEDDPSEKLLATDTLNAVVDASLGYYGQMLWSDPTAGTPSNLFNAPLSYSGDPGPITRTTTDIQVMPLEVDDIINQQSWQVVTNQIGCDYLLSSVTTTGYTVPMLYYGQ